MLAENPIFTLDRILMGQKTSLKNLCEHYYEAIFLLCYFYQQENYSAVIEKFINNLSDRIPLWSKEQNFFDWYLKQFQDDFFEVSQNHFIHQFSSQFDKEYLINQFKLLRNGNANALRNFFKNNSLNEILDLLERDRNLFISKATGSDVQYFFKKSFYSVLTIVSLFVLGFYFSQLLMAEPLVKSSYKKQPIELIYHIFGEAYDEIFDSYQGIDKDSFDTPLGLEEEEPMIFHQGEETSKEELITQQKIDDKALPFLGVPMELIANKSPGDIYQKSLNELFNNENKLDNLFIIKDVIFDENVAPNDTSEKQDDDGVEKPDTLSELLDHKEDKRIPFEKLEEPLLLGSGEKTGDLSQYKDKTVVLYAFLESSDIYRTSDKILSVLKKYGYEGEIAKDAKDYLIMRATFPGKKNHDKMIRKFARIGRLYIGNDVAEFFELYDRELIDDGRKFIYKYQPEDLPKLVTVHLYVVPKGQMEEQDKKDEK